MGAEHILVMNLPDLGVTPRVQSLGMGAAVTQICATYNQHLELALDALAQAGIPTIRLDAFRVLQDLAAAPAEYGFTDVSSQLKDLGPVTNPEQCLFWDEIHPTTAAHQVLAHEAVGQLLDHFSSRNGNATPDAAANGLHGLVNAADHSK